MVSNLKLIYNPAAKGGKSNAIVEKVCDYLDKIGFDYGFAETEKPLDGIEQAEYAIEEGYSTVCSIGGDGTAHEVANGAIRAGLTFGIIPAGSGNDFAHGIGLSGNWKEAIDVVLNGKKEKVSIVQIGDRYSINVVDAGLGGAVAKKSLTKLRWMGGSKKYTILMLGTLISHKPYPCKLTIDGEEYDYDINIIAAGFGQTFGSGMRILPDARYNKKLMDLAVIHSASKFTILRIFPKVFSGEHVNYTKYVTMFNSNEVIIEPKSNEREMVSEAEGEIVGTAPTSFKAIEKGLEVIIPKEWTLDSPSLAVD